MDNRTQKSDAYSESEEEIFVHSVETETGDEWFPPLSVNGTILPLKIDTGAQANLLSIKDYNALKQRPKIKKGETNLTCLPSKDRIQLKENAAPFALRGKLKMNLID